jgi:hypothetical protein
VMKDLKETCKFYSSSLYALVSFDRTRLVNRIGSTNTTIEKVIYGAPISSGSSKPLLDHLSAIVYN